MMNFGHKRDEYINLHIRQLLDHLFLVSIGHFLKMAFNHSFRMTDLYRTSKLARKETLYVVDSASIFPSI